MHDLDWESRPFRNTFRQALDPTSQVDFSKAFSELREAVLVYREDDPGEPFSTVELSTEEERVAFLENWKNTLHRDIADYYPDEVMLEVIQDVRSNVDSNCYDTDARVFALLNPRCEELPFMDTEDLDFKLDAATVFFRHNPSAASFVMNATDVFDLRCPFDGLRLYRYLNRQRLGNEPVPGYPDMEMFANIARPMSGPAGDEFFEFIYSKTKPDSRAFSRSVRLSLLGNMEDARVNFWVMVGGNIATHGNPDSMFQTFIYHFSKVLSALNSPLEVAAMLMQIFNKFAAACGATKPYPSLYERLL